MTHLESETLCLPTSEIDTHINTNSEQKNPQISIVIVNYNVKDFLRQTLMSLQEALKPFSHEIFVVDNASEDSSVALVREQFSNVKIIANTTNLGFAKANNLALKHVKGDYIVLINPDTVVQEDTFTELVKFIEKTPDAGMVGCKILNADGSLQLACRRSFPTPWVALTRLTGLSYLFPRSRFFGKYNLTYLPEDETCSVDAISGSFMMLKRQTFKQIGYLDERFFLYGEDLDWCLRTIEAGWKIYYVPATQIIHYQGESSKNTPFDSLFDFNRAMALFVKKHFRQRYFFVTYYLLLLAVWLQAGFSFIQRWFGKALPVIIDALLLQISLAAAIFIKFGDLQNWSAYLPVNLVYSLAWLLALSLAGAYNKRKLSAMSAGLAVLAGFVFNSALTYFFKEYAFSRAVILVAGGLNLALLAGWRLGFKVFYHSRFTALAHRTLVVGDFSKGEEVLEKLRLRIRGSYEIVGLVSTNPGDVGLEYSGWQVITETKNIREVIRAKNIQEVIFSTHRIPYDHVLKIIAESRFSRVNFKLIPSTLDVIIGKASIDRLSDIPLLEIDYKLAHPRYRFVKRAFDIVFSILALTAGLPIFMLLALMKFRKLQIKRIEINAKKQQTLSAYEITASRVIGRLPWLWHVLTGKLSVVGRELGDTIEKTSGETEFKPGLTGLVQVNRHRNLSPEEKEKFQLFYLTNYTPLLDLEIILKTVFRV